MMLGCDEVEEGDRVRGSSNGFSSAPSAATMRARPRLCAAPQAPARRDAPALAPRSSADDAAPCLLPSFAAAWWQLELWFKQARRDGTFVAIAFVGLEEIPPAAGRSSTQVRDGLRSALASRFFRMLGPDNVVAELDERTFLVAARGLSSPTEVTWLAWAIEELIEQPLSLDGADMTIRPYLGVSVYPGDGTTVHALLQRAEEALGIAGRLRRPGVQFWVDPRVRWSPRRPSHGFAGAVADSGLQLRYGLQFNQRLQQYRSCEALLKRGDAPYRGMAPAEAPAEELASEPRLTRAVLVRACRQLAQWQAHGSALSRVAMHFSERQLLHAGFADAIERTIVQTGLRPEQLDIELSHAAAMRAGDALAAVLQELSATGVGIVLDGFGAEGFDLPDLSRLPIDGIKLDRRVPAACIANQAIRGHVREIGSLARLLSLSVAADGIATAEQRELLAHLGCHLFQGPELGELRTAERSGQLCIVRTTSDPPMFGTH